MMKIVRHMYQQDIERWSYAIQKISSACSIMISQYPLSDRATTKFGTTNALTDEILKASMTVASRQFENDKEYSYLFDIKAAHIKYAQNVRNAWESHSDIYDYFGLWDTVVSEIEQE